MRRWHQSSDTAVRISLGTPKWPIGYNLDAEMKDLMPFGLLNKFEQYEDFERAYFDRLNQKGVQRMLLTPSTPLR